MGRRTSGEKFGVLIRDYRRRKNWTQSDLAQALGYGSPQFISLLERNEAKVPLEALGHLCVALDLPEEIVITCLTDQYREEISQKLIEGKEARTGPFWKFFNCDRECEFGYRRVEARITSCL